MNQLSSIGVNHKDFSQRLITRFYLQMVRSQFEYGLAINIFTSAQIIKFENDQKHCLRTIFGGSSRSSVDMMLHLVRLPTMKKRINTLRTQFLLRSLYLPERYIPLSSAKLHQVVFWLRNRSMRTLFTVR
jgi:hypothetical protein